MHRESDVEDGDDGILQGVHPTSRVLGTRPPPRRRSKAHHSRQPEVQRQQPVAPHLRVELGYMLLHPWTESLEPSLDPPKEIKRARAPSASNIPSVAAFHYSGPEQTPAAWVNDGRREAGTFVYSFLSRNGEAPSADWVKDGQRDL